MTRPLPMTSVAARLLLAPFCLLLSAAAFGTTASGSGETIGGPADNSFTAFDGGLGPGALCTVGMPNYWVNTATRQMVVQDTEFSSAGLGPKVATTRTYNMPRRELYSGMFGNAWSFSYESTVDHSGQSLATKEVYLRRGSGKTLTYRVDLASPAPVKATPGIASPDTLTWYGTHWVYVEKNTQLSHRYDKVAGANLSRLASIADADGNAVTINYNGDGTIGRVADAAGRTTSFAYDAHKRCIAMTTADGSRASYEYSAGGDLLKTTDFLGFVSAFEYDASHYMSRMTAGGKTTVFNKSDDGTIRSVVDANGNATLYGPDPRYFASAVIDPKGGIRRYFDTGGEGWTQLITDALDNRALDVMFDFEIGLPSQFVDADGFGDGAQTSFTYDAAGNPVKIETGYLDPADQEYHRITKTLVRDAGGSTASVTDCLGETSSSSCSGETWSYTYDARRHLTRIRSPSGREMVMSYDAKGQLVNIANAPGKSVQFTYDPFGNLKTTTDEVGNVTARSYGAQGLRLASLTDARGNTTLFDSDANGRVTKVTNPDGTFRSYAYDCCAATSVTDENGHVTTVARDPLLRVTRRTDALGKLTNAGYDQNGNLVSVSDALNRPSSRTHDAANRLVAMTDPNGGILDLAYDRKGNLVSLADERGESTGLAYDHLDRLTGTTDPLGKQVNFAYDAVGRLKRVTNARGGTSSLTYDGDGRLVGKAYGGSNVATYGYDNVGNLQTVADAGGTTAYAYDAASRVTGISYPNGRTVTQSYDATGNLQTLGYPNGVLVTYSYDNRNRINRVAWGSHTIDFTYDAAGNLLTETRSNGVVSSYGYDAEDRLIAVAHRKGASTIADLAYTRDAAGQITAEDGVHPLLPAFAAGSASGAYDEANGLATWNGDSYSYDADGNLTAITGSRAFSATYDAENRPVSITRGGSATTYVYDGLGRRVRAQSSTATRNFHHDAWQRLLFETDAAGQVTATYIHAGQRLVASGTASNFVFHHPDKTGSTLALTDSAGAVAGAFAYSPYGELQGSSGTATTPFKFVGTRGVTDEGDGLYFMKNRYYDAVTGRFLQKDPIGFAGGFNLYEYVGGNPVARIDPDGTFWPAVAAVLTAAAIVEGVIKITGAVSNADNAIRTAPRPPTASELINIANGPDPFGQKARADQAVLNGAFNAVNQTGKVGVEIIKVIGTVGPIRGCSAVQVLGNAAKDRVRGHAADIMLPTSDKRWWEVWK